MQGNRPDFAEYQFPWGKRHALLVVLGYSRLLWLRFYERQKMQTLFGGIGEAFHFFSGVPHELFFDQMKSVITRDERAHGLMSRRYEHAFTVLTSNKGFEAWGEIFGDDVMAAALIDRLVHHCHIVNIRGDSYLMRDHAELRNALHPDLRPESIQTTTHHWNPPGMPRRADLRSL